MFQMMSFRGTSVCFLVILLPSQHGSVCYIERTRCVDTTISNIVEGTIQFSPEAVPSSAQSRLPSSPVKAIASDRKKQGSLQPKPAPYRPLSLKERKKAFIEDARR